VGAARSMHGLDEKVFVYNILIRKKLMGGQYEMQIKTKWNLK